MFGSFTAGTINSTNPIMSSSSTKRPPWRPEPWEASVAQPVCFGLFVMSICDGTGIPLLALMAALRHLQQRGIHYKIIHTFIWENDVDSIKLGQHLRSSIHYPGHVTGFKDAKDFPRFCKTVFIPNDVLVLALTGFPCTRISRGARMATRHHDYGLHAPPTNLWWDIHQGYVILQQKVSVCLITFNENVIPANRIDKNELDNTAGHCQLMNTIRSEGAPRDRFSWTSIGYSQPTEEVIVVMPPQHLPMGLFMDSWGSSRMYPVLRAIIPSRLYTLALDPSSIPAAEKAELRKFFLYESRTGNLVLPNIDTMAMFMAVPPAATQAFAQAFPCKPTFKLHNKDGQLVEFKCQEQVWCENCSTIAKALGAAWNTSTTARHVSQLLATFAMFCDFPDDITDIILEEETCKYSKPHYCTDKCVKNRNAL